MATLRELEIALVNADKAGDMDAARKLAAVIAQAKKKQGGFLPNEQVQETLPEKKPPGFVDKFLGAGEAILSTTTGAVGGTAGLVGGAIKGVAEQVLSGEFGTPQAMRLIEKSATEGAQSLTYAPRTEYGQELMHGAAETLQNVPAILPVIGPVGAVGQSVKMAAPAVSAVAKNVGVPVIEAAKKSAIPISKAVQQVKQVIQPSETRQASAVSAPVGAGATDLAMLRQAKASELDVPIKLTEGQKTRSLEQQRFEREIAKNPEFGAPIRQRFAQQNLQIQQNIDSFIDSTGAKAADLRSIGLSVSDALRSKLAKDKAQIRSLYKEAEKAGEMETPIQLDSVVNYLKENAPEAEVANILKVAKAKALQLGVAAEDANGNLIAKPVSLKTAELFRRAVGNATNADKTNIMQSASIKELVDNATANSGGQLYRQARDARARLANNYENVSIVKNLVGSKRGSNDRAIALEDVLKRTIIDSRTDFDSLRQVRKLLQTEGENGKQAWKELQGGALQYIKDEATKNVARDEMGNAIISAAQLDKTISNLDKSGKLEFLFGKQGAEKLRTLNDVAKDVLVAPPGSVNSSNTSAVLAGFADVVFTGMAGGIPTPLASVSRIGLNSIRDAKLRARVKKALGENSNGESGQ